MTETYRRLSSTSRSRGRSSRSSRRSLPSGSSGRRPSPPPPRRPPSPASPRGYPTGTTTAAGRRCPDCGRPPRRGAAAAATRKWPRQAPPRGRTTLPAASEARGCCSTPWRPCASASAACLSLGRNFFVCVCVFPFPSLGGSSQWSAFIIEKHAVKYE